MPGLDFRHLDQGLADFIFLVAHPQQPRIPGSQRIEGFLRGLISAMDPESR